MAWPRPFLAEGDSHSCNTVVRMEKGVGVASVFIFIAHARRQPQRTRLASEVVKINTIGVARTSPGEPTVGATREGRVSTVFNESCWWLSELPRNIGGGCA